MSDHDANWIENWEVGNITSPALETIHVKGIVTKVIDMTDQPTPIPLTPSDLDALEALYAQFAKGKPFSPKRNIAARQLAEALPSLLALVREQGLHLTNRDQFISALQRTIATITAERDALAKRFLPSEGDKVYMRERGTPEPLSPAEIEALEEAYQRTNDQPIVARIFAEVHELRTEVDCFKSGTARLEDRLERREGMYDRLSTRLNEVEGERDAVRAELNVALESVCASYGYSTREDALAYVRKQIDHTSRRAARAEQAGEGEGL